MSVFEPTTISGDAWAPYEPSDGVPWNLQRVVHLHRRAAFAAPWTVLQRDLAAGPQEAVEHLLTGHERSDTGNSFEAMAQTIGEAATASDNPDRLKAWWLYRMLMSPDPLGERLTLMWHNHFATSNRKVQDLVRMREQNELFREQSRVHYGKLLETVVKHPAMLTWLDAESNRKGHPNENLARELMELFTVGIGNYSEDDVKDAARSLTGWTVVEKQFVLREEMHDDAEKKLLGQRGAFTGDDLLGILIDHPGTALRVAWRICHTFMGENIVDEQALSQLADGLRKRQLDIAWAVETVLRSQLFFSANNIQARVVGPVEYIIGALRTLELCDPPPSTLLLSEWAERMGQDLFYPPNVGGWNEGRAWLGSQTIVARANFAAALVKGQLWHSPRQPMLGELPRGDRSRDLAGAVAWFARLLWGQTLPSIVTEVVATVDTLPAVDQLSTAVALLMARPENQLA